MLTVLFDVAEPAYLPDLVAREEFVRANGLLQPVLPPRWSAVRGWVACWCGGVAGGAVAGASAARVGAGGALMLSVLVMPPARLLIPLTAAGPALVL